MHDVSSGNVFRREGIVLHEVSCGYVFERRQFLQRLRRGHLLQRGYGGVSEVSRRYHPEREQDGLHGLQRGNVCGVRRERMLAVSRRQVLRQQSGGLRRMSVRYVHELFGHLRNGRS